MSVEATFKKLLSQKLNLTSECDGEHDGETRGCDICRVSNAHQKLREKLEAKLKIKPNDGNPSTFLTGSYIRHTMIRPPKDVDFFVVLDKGDYTDQNLGILIKPVKLLEKLEQTLSHIASELGGTMEPQEHSITVKYDDDFSIDVIPAFEADEGNDYLIPSRSTDKYLVSNPKVHADIVSEHNEETADGDIKRFRKIVRILKSLKKDVFNEDPLKLKSFHMEMLAARIFEGETITSIASGLNTYFSEITKHLIEECCVDYANETNFVDDYFFEKDESIREAIILKLEEFAELAQAAIEHEEAGDEDEAIETWAKIFPSLAVFLEVQAAEAIGQKIAAGHVYRGQSSQDLRVGDYEKSSVRRVPASSSWRS